MFGVNTNALWLVDLFWFFDRFENFDGTSSMRARVDERLAGNFLGGERPVAGGHLGGLLRQGAGGHDRMGQTGAWWVMAQQPSLLTHYCPKPFSCQILR